MTDAPQTDTPDTLVERLRARTVDIPDGNGGWETYPVSDCAEAADRIEALERRVAELEGANAAFVKHAAQPLHRTVCCPNCGNVYRVGECSHSSSGPFGTLYGVCQKCADGHADFNRTMTGALPHG